ncbi:hypothetical protein M0R45_038029 [Rubus argutus]|uniref:Uncharacterized protein n=1 Tax=Rubus argutus TaxID=59490 RepID=A0AAW1W4G8_RUBAR
MSATGLPPLDENFTLVVKEKSRKKNPDPVREPIENKEQLRALTQRGRLDQEENEHSDPMMSEDRVMFNLPQTSYTKKSDGQNPLRNRIANTEEWKCLKEKGWRESRNDL